MIRTNVSITGIEDGEYNVLVCPPTVSLLRMDFAHFGASTTLQL